MVQEISKPRHHSPRYGAKRRYRSLRDNRHHDYSKGRWRNPSPSLNGMVGQALHNGETPLFDQLCQYETLLEQGWKKVRKGRTIAARRFNGAADRVSLELYERHLEPNLRRLGYELRSGRYRPGPVSHFRLPKPGGDFRTLSVLTVKDRIAQRVALSLIEPLWERHFLPCSHAFRPERSIYTALSQVEEYYAGGWRWVVDADIESFFDRIERNRLVGLLSERLPDRRLLALLELSLNHTPALVYEPKPAPPLQNNEVGTEDEDEAEGGEPTQEPGLHTARRWLEEGLDWGMERLRGSSPPSSFSASPYYRGSSSYYATDRTRQGWSYNYDEDEDESAFANRTETRSVRRDYYAPEENSGWHKETLRRIGLDGAMLGMSLARQAMKHGLPHLPMPGGLGLVVKTGAAVGAAGTMGVWAARRWRNRPTLYELETANFRRETRLQKATSHRPESGRYADFTGGFEAPQRGIAQGSVLSPFYSNVYLHEFDRQLTTRGYKLVRFADDLLILCRSQREAFGALDEAERLLAEIGLNFKPSKTRVCPLGEGFKFLGAEFGRDGRWKPGPEGGLARSKKAAASDQTSRNWLDRARQGWLGRTVRTKPGTVQKGRRGKVEDNKAEKGK